MEACVFCAIIDGKAEGSVVYRDDIVIVFMDIQPVNPGHLLVCPLKHQVDFNDLDPEIGSYMFKIAQQMAQAIKKTKIKCKGINLFFADGEEADQEIFHAHLHVIPRYSGDGFMFVFDDSYYELPPRSELDFIATEIKHAL